MGSFFSQKQAKSQPKEVKNPYESSYNYSSTYKTYLRVSRPTLIQQVQILSLQPISQPYPNRDPQPTIQIYPRLRSQPSRKGYRTKEKNQLQCTHKSKTIEDKVKRRQQEYYDQLVRGIFHSKKQYILNNRQAIKPPDFVPYEGCVGKWVARSDYTRMCKTFGFFKCDSCHKIWVSAHSKKQFRQACRVCSQYVSPAYLWVNDYRNYQNDSSLVDNHKHHRSDLCQACKKIKYEKFIRMNQPAVQYDIEYPKRIFLSQQSSDWKYYND